MCLDLLAELQQRLELSVLIITHDLGIVAQYCDAVVVMHDGRNVEDGPKHLILKSPKKAYTRQLITASKLDDLRTEPSEHGRLMAASPPVVVQAVSKTFKQRGRRGRTVVALDDVTFSVGAGQALGVVGESGCGKSTLARCILGLVPPDSGRIEVLGRTVTGAGQGELRAWRRDIQIVFQEPYDSLSPRLRVFDSIAEPLVLHTELSGDRLRDRVLDLMSLVALETELAKRFPHQLSGGQAQRVNIASALATEPKVLVLDEPTSSLDVSVRAGILRLLLRLRSQLGLTYLLISHDLPTIRGVCDVVAVMYLGRLVEIGPTRKVLRRPAHPYTEFLLGAELPLDSDVKLTAPPVRGEVDPSDRAAGCIFQHRCPLRVSSCEEAQPPLAHAGEKHDAACIRVGTSRPETTPSPSDRMPHGPGSTSGLTELDDSDEGFEGRDT